MIRTLVVLAALGSLAVACVILAVVPHAGQEPVYSVAALSADLRREPAAWVGRTVRVRAIAEVCTVCGGWQPVQPSGPGTDTAAPLPPTLLKSAEGTGATAAIPIVIAPGSPPPAFLRQIPLLDRLVAAPHTVQWSVVAVYRVQLCAAGCAAGLPPQCYAAVLLDAAS
jgi:hypothetical protein